MSGCELDARCFGQASVECGANLLMYSVRRVGTDKFGCRVIRRLFVGANCWRPRFLTEGSRPSKPCRTPNWVPRVGMQNKSMLDHLPQHTFNLKNLKP